MKTKHFYNSIAFIAVLLAMLLAVFGCQNQSPMSPDVTQIANQTSGPLSQETAVDPVAPTDETEEVGGCEFVNLHRAGIKVRVDGLKVYMTVPMDVTLGEPYFKLMKPPYRNGKKFDVNREVFIGETPPGEHHRHQVFAETKTDSGKLYQCDVHWVEWETKEEKKPVCVEWEEREVSCPLSQTTLGDQVNCKPKKCYETVCVKWGYL